MNTIQEINRINKAELETGLTGTTASWHAKYSKSAWVYTGNLPTQLTEGDVLAVMSQWGEIEDINLVREEGTGKSRGFCFIKYEDCRSCVLAVDNFNGSKILGRSLRVDHVENYRLPKHLREKEEGEGNDDEGNDRIDQNGNLKAGHAYEGKELKSQFNIHQGQDLFAPVQENSTSAENDGAHDDDENAGLSKEERQEAKLKRKAERDRIRREREIRRQEKEEKRRQKRAKVMEKGERSNIEDGDKKERRKRDKQHRESKRDKEHRHSKKKRRKHERQRSNSE